MNTLRSQSVLVHPRQKHAGAAYTSRTYTTLRKGRHQRGTNGAFLTCQSGSLVSSTAPSQQGISSVSLERRSARRSVQARPSWSLGAFPGFPEIPPPPFESPDAVSTGREVEGSWVIEPENQTPVGVVHFLGGAFAGASPQLSYAALLEGFAKAGYLVITTPFDLTFNHLQCAKSVAMSLDRCLTALNTTPAPSQPSDDSISSSEVASNGYRSLPVYAVGHSNGSLLHLLIGSLEGIDGTRVPDVKASVLMSYNNKPVSEAVPGGLSPQVAPVLSQVKTLGDILKTQLSSSGLPTIDDIPKPTDSLSQAALPFIEQLDTTLSELAEGAVDFTPTPTESRALIQQHYRVPQTLLIEFEDDNTDESPEMLDVLNKNQVSGVVEYQKLPGVGHVTPLGADLTWEVKGAFSPLDAIGQAIKSDGLRRVDELTNNILMWMKRRV